MNDFITSTNISLLSSNNPVFTAYFNAYQRLQHIFTAVRYSLKSYFLLLSTILLIACANAPYGSYVSSKDCGDVKALARDAANYLNRTYLPAKIKIEFTHDADDEFGRELVSLLRHKGYAVQEFIPARLRPAPSKSNPDTNTKSLKCEAIKHSPNTPSPCVKEEPAIELSYVLDQIGQDNLYRLSLVTDSALVSRAYYVEDSVFIAASEWLARR